MRACRVLDRRSNCASWREVELSGSLTNKCYFAWFFTFTLRNAGGAGWPCRYRKWTEVLFIMMVPSPAIISGARDLSKQVAFGSQLDNLKRMSKSLERSRSRTRGYGSCSPHPRARSPSPEKPVSWAALPHKGQLAMIVFARLAEPLAERSLTSFLFFQLQWFDHTLSEATIATQAGVLTSAFAAAQCATGMWWGYIADSPRCGRKNVLIMGLLGTCMSSLGLAFSRSFLAALFFRVLAGALNGNVGVLRTMISEVVDDKRCVENYDCCYLNQLITLEHRRTRAHLHHAGNRARRKGYIPGCSFFPILHLYTGGRGADESRDLQRARPSKLSVHL